jgi:hypothetical protein
MLQVARIDGARSTKPNLLRVLAICFLLAGGFAGMPGTAEAQPPPGLTTLYRFTGGTDGAIILKGVTVDPSGNLYGNAFYGANACPYSYNIANAGCGTIWKLDTRYQ